MNLCNSWFFFCAFEVHCCTKSTLESCNCRIFWTAGNSQSCAGPSSHTLSFLSCINSALCMGAQLSSVICSSSCFCFCSFEGHPFVPSMRDPIDTPMKYNISVGSLVHCSAINLSSISHSSINLPSESLVRDLFVWKTCRPTVYSCTSNCNWLKLSSWSCTLYLLLFISRCSPNLLSSNCLMQCFLFKNTLDTSLVSTVVCASYSTYSPFRKYSCKRNGCQVP